MALQTIYSFERAWLGLSNALQNVPQLLFSKKLWALEVGGRPLKEAQNPYQKWLFRHGISARAKVDSEKILFAGPEYHV